MENQVESKENMTKDPIKKESLLTGNFYLVLHTQLAQKLFYGKLKNKQIGLMQFASMVRQLWIAVKGDDPYADLQLLRTYENLEKAKAQLKEHETAIQKQINNMRGFEIELMSNPTPLRAPLLFGTPYAFMAAMLLEQVDHLERQLITLHHLGLLSLEKLSASHLFIAVQAIFTTPTQWKYTGITRKDILEKNQKAEEVKKILGEVPTAILNREIQFAFLPKVRNNNDVKITIKK